MTALRLSILTLFIKKTVPSIQKREVQMTTLQQLVIIQNAAV